jgi:hypothetical protein
LTVLYKEIAIDCKRGGTTEMGRSQLLFGDGLYERFRGLTNYDVNSDGRLLMVKASAHAQINIIIDWSEKLKRLAPEGRK